MALTASLWGIIPSADIFFFSWYNSREWIPSGNKAVQVLNESADDDDDNDYAEGIGQSPLGRENGGSLKAEREEVLTGQVALVNMH